MDPDPEHCKKYKGYLYQRIIILTSYLIFLIFIILNFRNCPTDTTLKDWVPLLASYDALKSQFDIWSCSSGNLSHIADLDPESGYRLKNLKS